jgi:hypothetical protein
VQNDLTITNNQPGILLHDNEKGKCVLRDFAFSGDRNVIKIIPKNFLKSKELIVDILRL